MFDATASGKTSSIDAPATSQSLTVVYNSVLHGLLISARHTKAEELFEDMCVNGPKPDITSFNTFIRHLGRKGDMQRIATLLRQLQEFGLKPDVFTFTSVLHASLQSGVSVSEAVETVESAMRAGGVKPNVVTYTTIIDQTLRQGGHQNILAAFGWIEMMQKRNMQPNEVTWTALLSALQKDRSLDPEYVDVQSRAITARMQANGAKMNRVTFHILLQAALSRDAGQEGLVRAVEIYGQMTRQGIKGNADTWYMLLHETVDRKAWALGLRLLDEMTKVEFVPQGRVASLARRIQMRS